MSSKWPILLSASRFSSIKNNLKTRFSGCFPIEVVLSLRICPVVHRITPSSVLRDHFWLMLRESYVWPGIKSDSNMIKSDLIYIYTKLYIIHI